MSAPPPEPARRRRRVRVAAAVAAVLAVAVAAGLAGVAGTDRSGSLERENLLRWLPDDTGVVYLVDLEAYAGTPGIDLQDPEKRAAVGYFRTRFGKLDVAPFGRLIADNLVTFAGNGIVDLYVLDVPVERAEERVRAAGWEPVGDGLWRAGDGDASARVGSVVVRIDGDGGRAILAVGGEGTQPPDVLGEDPPEAGAPAQRLLDLGGAVGVGLAVDASDACLLTGATLGSSPDEATALIVPPAGQSPDDLEDEQVLRLDGVTGVGELVPEGDVARVELEIEGPLVPREIVERLGLPGSTIC